MYIILYNDGCIEINKLSKDWNQSSRDIFNFVRAICRPGPQATSFIRGEKILINKVKIVEGAHPYKNTVGQVVGKSEKGFFVNT
ncbi:hypothetical protein GN277_11005 [Lachnospiraceae bacterium WCA-9-b2]|uniref:Methionyl-tRNA formyltransferase n=1 Tax=Sporofaciens musculi TaxID=2681861 RepID=A0A7X3MGH6_9FIRM|nr:hypothetical protein [Sporofaciens musculi]